MESQVSARQNNNVHLRGKKSEGDEWVNKTLHRNMRDCILFRVSDCLSGPKCKQIKSSEEISLNSLGLHGFLAGMQKSK